MQRQSTADRQQELNTLIDQLNRYKVTATLDAHAWPEVVWVIIPQGTAPEIVGEILLTVSVHYRRLGLTNLGITPSMQNGSMTLRFS